MTTDVTWVFERVGPMGGATGMAFANTLQGSGISPEEELARETIQNSCDAIRRGEIRVRVVFRLVALEGEHRRQFLKTLALDSAIGSRLRELSLPPDNVLAQSGPLHLLYVEDYGTEGLHGDPHNRRSNFHRLLLSMGDTDKIVATESTGGSYGYGKAALSMNSKLRTIVAYSAFTPDETGARARLMGCAYLDAHEFSGAQWTGRAWFGVPRGAEASVVDPLCDADAHEWAERLGFQRRRGAEDYGTSILIVDSDVRDQQSLRKAVERWWWPRLLDEQLEVLVEANGEVCYPEPRRQPSLAPFIECYRLAIGATEPTGPHQKRDRFYRVSGLSLGQYALQILPSDHEVAEELVGTVALIRAPKMVVQYANVGYPEPPTVGVFVADNDIDPILRLSEPPNHDRWDPQSRRLQIAQPDEATAREVVTAIGQRIKTQLRRFQREATPPRRPEDRRITFLEQLLGSIFRSQARGGDGSSAEAGPVEVRFREGPRAVPDATGRVITWAKVALRLRPDAESEALDTIVRVRVPILEDDHGSEGDLLQILVEHDDQGALLPPVTEPEFNVLLSKKEWYTFTLSSAPYDPVWSTKIDVEVVPEEVRK